MYDIFKKETIYNAYEKENTKILNKIKDNQIKRSIFYENANYFLLVFIVGKYDLIFYYKNNQKEYYENKQLNQFKKQISIKKFPTIKEHGELRDLCFNSSGDTIFILFKDGLIISLSVIELTEQFQSKINLLNIDANLIYSKSLCSSTNIIVWYSLDAQQEIAIIGNDLGEICFINIDKKYIIKKTSIKKSIKNLRIIRDKFTVTLLITTNNNSQLKLPLEENRLSLILNQDNDADNIKFMEENRFKLFSCFIVYNTAQQPEIDEDKINIKPVPVQIEIKKKITQSNNNCTNLLNSFSLNHHLQTTSSNLLINTNSINNNSHNHHLENNSKLNCILINQQSFILATYYQENTNLASINIYEGNEFTYEFITPLSKYCFPKECVSLDNIIALVTERLIITANSNSLFIISKSLSDFRRENIENSILSSIEFDSKILNVFRLNENIIDNYLDTLIVVTSQCAYKLRPKMNCEQIFIELLSFNNQINNQINSQIGNQLILNQISRINNFNLKKFNNNDNTTSNQQQQQNTKLTTNYYAAHEFAFMMRLNLNSLYEKTIHYFLQNKQYQKVLELFQTSEKISKLELIKNFLSYGYLNEAINIINHLFEEKNNDLDDKDKVSFSNVYIACSIQRILEKKVMNEKNKTKLKKFLITNIYYNEQYVIKLLISSYMFDLAKLCASIRNNYACLIRNLLNIDQIQRELLQNDFYDKIDQSIYKDVLLFTKCKDYFKCLLTSNILQGFFIESELISKYLKLLIETLPQLQLDNKLLRKAAYIFDPRNSQVQIFLNNVVSKLNQKYMCYTLEKDDDDNQLNIIQKKDLINFFIFVNLIILKNQKQNTKFDERILGVLIRNKFKTSSFIQSNTELDYNQTNEFNLDNQDYLVSAGQTRGFLIKHGNLFSFGSAKYGADGEVNINCNRQSFEPKLNTFFSELLSIKVITVNSGAHHTLILTKISCYAVGQSIYGQLGCGKRIQYTRYPKVIQKLQNLIIQKLVCGQYHSFALTIDGYLYSWGWGIHGQLGHDSTETLYEPKLIKYFKNKKVVDVSAGYCHSIVLDSDGLVYSFGNNVYGQLGSNDEKLKKSCLPQPIYLIKEKINLISSKYFQSLAYCKESRSIYYFGTSPQNNQLMAQQLKKMRSNQQQNNENLSPTNLIAQNNEHHTPRKFSLEFDVKKLETGNLHCMLLTEDGKVYSWGRGSEGQLGHGSEKSIVLPKLIETLDNKIVDIACGYDFSLCVDVNGELYGFGQNMDHQLGFISKFEQKTSLNGVNNLLDNKKLRFKSKKVLTMLSSKQIEKQPVHIELKKDQFKNLSYLDSLTVDFTIDQFKEEVNSKLNNFENNNSNKIRRLNNKDKLELNNYNLCKIIYKLKNELDLRLILNTCISLDNYLCCGFICELLKEPLNALEYYIKSAFTTKSSLDNQLNGSKLEETDYLELKTNQIKEILIYFINRFMTNDSTTFKMLIVKFLNLSLTDYTLKELELILIEIYEHKICNFIFGLFLFELMDSNEFEIELSNEFKIKLMKITFEYLKSAKINEFMVEPALSLLSSISNNQNLLSAEKLWKNILNNIQKELDKKRKTSLTNQTSFKKNGDNVDLLNKSSTSLTSLKTSKSIDEQQELNNFDLNEEDVIIEIVPEDDKFYIFSCNHHFSTDYFNSILLKQLKIINSDFNNKLDLKKITENSNKCPLCS